MTTASGAASGQKSVCRHVRLKKTESLSISGEAYYYLEREREKEEDGEKERVLSLLWVTVLPRAVFFFLQVCVFYHFYQWKRYYLCQRVAAFFRKMFKPQTSLDAGVVRSAHRIIVTKRLFINLKALSVWRACIHQSFTVYKMCSFL